MNKVVIILVGVLTLAACDFKFDVPLLPNIKAKIDGNSDPTKLEIESPGETVTEQSKANAQEQATTPQTKSKVVLANLEISNEVRSDWELDQDINCVQAVEISEVVVIDFIKSACPSDLDQIVDASKIIFTATYSVLGNGHYELKFEGDAIGSMSLNDQGDKLVLDQLCSGNYLSSCFLPTSNSQFSDLPVAY